MGYLFQEKTWLELKEYIDKNALVTRDIGKKFSIYYSSEILRGEKFDIYTAETGREFTFLAKNPATGKDIFSALIDF